MQISLTVVEWGSFIFSRERSGYFQSSVGHSNLGTGVIQLVQVMGNNNLVIANTNVTLNIKNFQTIKPTVTGIGGLNFLSR